MGVGKGPVAPAPSGASLASPVRQWGDSGQPTSLGLLGPRPAGPAGSVPGPGLPMIGRMRHADRTLRGPAAHRVVAAVASPVIGYFVARLVLRLADLPPAAVYGLCVAVGVLLGYRAWSARVELTDDTIRVHNTLLTQSVARTDIRRVNEVGAIEWHASAGRSTRAPVEVLHRPWWALGSGERTYRTNREELRSWLRAARRRAGEQESYTDVIPIVSEDPLDDWDDRPSGTDGAPPPGGPR